MSFEELLNATEEYSDWKNAFNKEFTLLDTLYREALDTTTAYKQNVADADSDGCTLCRICTRQSWWKTSATVQN
jgi:hypothetical protein